MRYDVDVNVVWIPFIIKGESNCLNRAIRTNLNRSAKIKAKFKADYPFQKTNKGPGIKMINVQV